MQPAAEIGTTESTVPLHQAPARPPARGWRMVKAYWVTFVVLASYLTVRLAARFRSPAAIERMLLARHKRNARRIERAILELQGLFIKVGQLISIMTNFLPREFRQELEGLQDQVPPRPFPDIEKRILDELYREVRDMILQELDFRAEAENSRRIAANFRERADVLFPRTVEEFTTS